MKHFIILLAVAVATSAAAPFPNARYSALTPTLEQQAPAPGFTPAPVPNPDLIAPSRAQQPKPELAPQLFRPRSRYGGEGFTPGSTVDAEQNQNVRPVPGMNLSVPLN